MVSVVSYISSSFTQMKKSVWSPSSNVAGGYISVCPLDGAVMERLIVKMEQMSKAVVRHYYFYPPSNIMFPGTLHPCQVVRSLSRVIWVLTERS